MGTAVFGQYMPGKQSSAEFRGRLTEGGDSSYEGLVVEVTNLRDRSIRDHIDVLADGSFGFRSLPEGDYQVRVTTLYDEVVATTLTSIAQGSPPWEIRLPRSKLSKPPAGSISLQQLNHPPSKQVQKLLDNGERLLHAQHYEDAAARLREATINDPDCLQAHADLGLALSRVGQWDGAEQEYRTAVSLDPRNSMLHSNLGAALTMLQRFDEAEVEVATALRIDPRNPRAHYVMAGVLLRKNAPLKEAMTHLLAAQDEVPSARVSIQKICAENRVPGCP